MSVLAFEPFPKIPRLNRTITVSEKIDGTNAAVIIQQVDPVEAFDLQPHPGSTVINFDGTWYSVAAQSRKRLISPSADNFGFAAWVWDSASALINALGPGRHFGEWWGSGIQKGYGLPKGEKRFSLFNTHRHGETDFEAIGLPNVAAVPVLYTGMFSQDAIDASLDVLRHQGSLAAPGFMSPEGVVVFHHASGDLYKAFVENDDVPKGLAEAV